MATQQKFLVAGDSFIRCLQSRQIRFHGTTIPGRVVDMVGFPGKGVNDVRLYLRCVQFQGTCQAACRHCVQ